MTLSIPQQKCLRDVREHANTHHSCRTMAEHGGRDGTVLSLVKRGLLARGPANQGVTITQAGLDVLDPPPVVTSPPAAPKPKRGAIPSKGGNDVVYTPDPLALAIVEHFQPRGTILEPFAGGGAFVRAFNAYNETHGKREHLEKWTGPGPITLVEEPLHLIHSMEIAPPDGSPGTDFFKQGPDLIHYDWIITNHPWSLTAETLEQCMWFSSDVVLLCYVNAIFTNYRLGMIESAGFVVAELAKVDRPKAWQSMGMQLAAIHLRARALYPPGENPDLRKMSRIHYHNPEPTK